RGAFYSRHDGSVIDAAGTTWPATGPTGGAALPGGLVDLEAGGFELVSRDSATHEIAAVATGGPAPACELAGVTPPCLVLRADQQAHRRLLRTDEWAASLRGAIQVQIPEPAGAAVPTDAATAVPFAAATAAAALAATIVYLAYRRSRRSHRARFLRLTRQVGRAIRRLDPVLAVVAAPAIEAARRATRRHRLDPASAEGQRVTRALETMQGELYTSSQRQLAAEQRELADDLVGRLQAALQAAAEASAGASPGVTEP
ncbi:MAG: hypothetical protein HY744_26880, partial [Deltaproteobacteria bacterium]|nr:hypothetical protein [Deltaproteobacteria bacterium]